MDHYGLKYLAHHLDRVGDQEHLFELVLSDTWRQMRLSLDFTGLGLTEDIEIALRSARRSGQTALSFYIVFCLLYGRVRDTANYFPLDALVLMAMLGQRNQSLRLASLITSPIQKIKAYIRLSSHDLDNSDKESAWDLLLEADRIASQLPDGDERDRALILVSANYGCFGEVDIALSKIESIQTVSVKEKGLGKLAEMLSQYGYVHEALRLVVKIESIAIKIDSFAEVARNIKKIQSFSDGELNIKAEVENLLPQFDPQNTAPEFVSNVVQALYTLDMIDAGRSMAERHLDPLWRINGLRGLAQRGNPELAQALLNQTPAHILKSAAQEDLAQIHAAAGSFRKSIKVIENMPVSMAQNGAWAAVIWKLAENKKYRDAQNQLKRITNPRMKLWSKAGIGQSLYQHGRKKEATEVFTDILKEISSLAAETQTNRLQAFRFETNKQLNDEIFGAACKLSLETDKLDRAVIFANRINDAKRKTDYLLRLVQLLINKADFDKAYKTVELIDESRRSKAQVMIAQKMAEIENYEYASAVTRNIPNSRAKDDGWTVLAASSAKNGNFDLAKEYIERISSPGARGQAMSNLAINLSKAGKIDDAIDLAETIQYADLKAAAYASIIPLVFQAGNEDRALSLWSYCAKTHYQNLSTVLLSVKMIEMGMFDRVMQLVMSLEHEEQGDVWIGISNSLLRSDRSDLLSNLQRLLGEPHSQKIHWSIVNYLIENGRFEEAKGMIPLFPDSRLRHNLARKLIAEMASQNDSNLGEIQENLPKDRIIYNAWQGKIDQAIDATIKFIDPRGHDSTFTELVAILSSKADFNGAFKILGRVTSQHYRVAGLKRITINSLSNLDDNPDRMNMLTCEALEIFRLHGEQSILTCLEIIYPLLEVLVSPSIVIDKIKMSSITKV